MSEPGPPVPAASPRATGEVVSPQLASFGQRLIGRVIDGVALVAQILLWVYFVSDRGASASSSQNVLYLLIIGVSVANDVALTSLSGGSLGKLICGTRVVRVADRRPITMGAATIRWAVLVVLSVVPFGGIADALYIFSGEMKQTLHDKAAGTIVVRVR